MYCLSLGSHLRDPDPRIHVHVCTITTKNMYTTRVFYRPALYSYTTHVHWICTRVVNEDIRDLEYTVRRVGVAEVCEACPFIQNFDAQRCDVSRDVSPVNFVNRVGLRTLVYSLDCPRLPVLIARSKQYSFLINIRVTGIRDSVKAKT